MYLVFTILYAFCICLCSMVTAEGDAPKRSLGLLKPKQSPKPVPISASLWRELQIYANLTSASYQKAGHCRSPPFGSTVANYINIKSTSTQGVIFRNDYTHELVLSFPGTDSKRDYETDMQATLPVLRIPGVSPKKCRGCRAYHGVQIAWRSIAPETRAALDKQLKKHPHYKVAITGHSLGGALAYLATASLRGLGYPVARTITFGQPRVANRLFAKYMDKINGASEHAAGHFYRVTHGDDGVPHVPTRSAGYYHSGTEYWEKNTKRGTESAHTTFRCFGDEPTNCNLGTHPKSVILPAHGYYSGIHMSRESSCG